jgi:hypothetical protein
VEPFLQLEQISHQVSRDGYIGEFPNDGTQFEFRMEADAMINAP